MEIKKDIFTTLETVKREIKKNKQTEKEISKIIKKPFNKIKTTISCIMGLTIFMLIVAYILMILLVSGWGEGRQWATDLIKETARSTINTGLHVIDILLGVYIGREIGKAEIQNKDEEV